MIKYLFFLFSHFPIFVVLFNTSNVKNVITPRNRRMTRKFRYIYCIVKLGLGLRYGVSEFFPKNRRAKSPKCFHTNVDVEQKYKYFLLGPCVTNFFSLRP